jgi:hypothetical protein
MSLPGPSPHFAAIQHFIAFGPKADIVAAFMSTRPQAEWVADVGISKEVAVVETAQHFANIARDPVLI